MTALWILIASVAPLLTADVPGEDKSDRDRLQGTWKVVALVDDGKEVPATDIKGARLTFDGARFTFKGGKEDFRGTFKADARSKGGHIDTTFIAEDDKEKGKAQGIYELDGKRLRIAWHDGGTRPKEFASKAGSGIRLIVLERQ